MLGADSRIPAANISFGLAESSLGGCTVYFGQQEAADALVIYINVVVISDNPTLRIC
jgi:hypothetical protein